MSQAPTIVLILTDPSGLRATLDGEETYRVLDAGRLDDTAPGDAPSLDADDATPRADEGPDLVISPLRPAGRALALYHRIRSDPEIPAVPALLLAPSDTDDPALGDASGASVLNLPGLKAATRGALRALVAHRLAVCDAPPSAAAGGPLAPDTSFRERVEALVERNLDTSHFTAGDLAGALGISRRHLTRRMKDTFGTAPAAYIRARRLDRARALLAGDPPSIAAVAEAVGFQSASSFTEAFRRATGQVPTDYAGEHDEPP